MNPSAELALANVLQKHTGSQALSDSGVLKGRALENHSDVIHSAFGQHQQGQPGQVPGIVNLNIAGAGKQLVCYFYLSCIS